MAEKAEGERHSALYTIARTLGQLVASGHLTRDEIYAQLYDAAQRNGSAAEDGGRNITQTINDGIEKGVSDGPDPNHSEPGDFSYTLPPKGATNAAGRVCSRCERTAKYLWTAPTGDVLCDTCRAEHTGHTGYVLPAPEDDPALTTERGKYKVDFLALKTAEFANAQWLIEPIIPAGRSVALYAAGKTGKSLLALDLVAAAASGRPILGGAPLETPINILYVDQEMTQPDLQERIGSLGYFDADHEHSLTTLAEHLHYWQLYPWSPLDTYAGGQELLAEACNVGAQLVVIDTLIRTVDGEENSADTIKNFSRHTAEPLKAAGIALLRIDHAGKDLTRGQRGTSAKRDDVDVVWLLKPATGTLPGATMLTLVREAARVDWIQEDIHITRKEGPPLAHVVPTVLELTSADMEVVNYLQDQGLWGHNVTNRNARDVINLSSLTAKNHRLAHIVKWMRRYGDSHPEAGERGGEHTLSSRGERGGERNDEKGNAQVSEGEREGNAAETKKKGKGNTNPPFRGGLGNPRRVDPLEAAEKNTRGVFQVDDVEQVPNAHPHVSPSPPERAAGDYASEESWMDLTASGEPLTHVSPPPEPAAGDDEEEEEDVPPAAAPREPDTIRLDEDLPTPW